MLSISVLTPIFAFGMILSIVLRLFFSLLNQRDRFNIHFSISYATELISYFFDILFILLVGSWKIINICFSSFHKEFEVL